MKGSHFSLLCLVFQSVMSLASTAIIRENVDDNHHECLVDYLSILGLAEGLRDANPLQNCAEYHISLNETLLTVYDELEKNLYEVLANQSEVECLVQSFKDDKFLEINIVKTSAFITSKDFNQNQLKTVFDQSRNIFVIAAFKCLINDEVVMEIFTDFSLKMNAHDDEFVCVEKFLNDLNSFDGENEVSALKNNEAFEKSSGIDEADTDLRDVEKSNFLDSFEVWTSTTADETTTDYFTVETTVHDGEFDNLRDLEAAASESKNTIVKILKSDYSSESEESCNAILTALNLRIKEFQYPSMTLAQNKCMKSKFTAKDATAMYHFIALNKFSANANEVQNRNENLRSVLFHTISNIIECAEILKLSDIIDNLLPTVDIEIADK